MKLGNQVNLTLHEFLDLLGLSTDVYILCIRYSLQHDEIFLKRSPSDIQINHYNVDLLKAWKPNLDIQFVLDPY